MPRSSFIHAFSTCLLSTYSVNGPLKGSLLVLREGVKHSLLSNSEILAKYACILCLKLIEKYKVFGVINNKCESHKNNGDQETAFKESSVGLCQYRKKNERKPSNRAGGQ